jgi:hypothetical protein
MQESSRENVFIYIINNNISVQLIPNSSAKICNHSAIFCNHYEPIKIELSFGGKN